MKTIDTEINLKYFKGQGSIQLRKINGDISMRLIDEHGLPVATANVRFEDSPPQPGCIWLKSWTENEGMLEWLEGERFAQRTGFVKPTDFVVAYEMRLSDALLEGLTDERQH